MTAPLREPFFLRGRRSVLQRAVIMSCVLAGLTAVAGWLAAATIVVMDRTISALGQETATFIAALAFGSIAALLLQAPLNFWNRHSWRWSLISIPSLTAIFYVFLKWFRYDSGLSPELHLPLGFLFAIGAAGLLQLRPQRHHVLAYLFSVGGAAVPALCFLLISPPDRFRIPALPPAMTRTVVYAIMFGGWFAALTIPWGLPFWWPPERESPPEPAP